MKHVTLADHAKWRNEIDFDAMDTDLDSWPRDELDRATINAQTDPNWVSGIDPGIRNYGKEPAADTPTSYDDELMHDSAVAYTEAEKQNDAWWRGRAVDAVVAVLGGLALYMAWKAAALHGWWWWQS